MALLLSLATIQIGLPLILFAWAWFGRPINELDWLARTLLMTGVAVAGAIAGLWLFPAVLVSYAVLALVPAFSLRAWYRTQSSGWTIPKGLWKAARVATAATAALLVIAFVTDLTRGWAPPPEVESVDLHFPLRGGEYYVANGGNRDLLNAHLATLGPAFASYRGQSYGVDILKLNGLVARAEGVLPSDPAHYVIFGEPVYAPCAGQVVAAVDGIADMQVPQVDRAHMAGNHVILRCGAFEVLLGHLQLDTVAVSAGDHVGIGELLGKVGNTGNSNEPHLHVSAQRPGVPGAPFGGEPVVVTFDGDYLVRNEIVRAGS